MLFRCIPFFLLHLEKNQKFGNKFFSNSSTKPSFTNIVANSNYICQYIVYDSLCFGGSSTNSNIVCLAMLVPQIKHKSKWITIIIIIDLSNSYYFHLHNLHISINSSSWQIRTKSIETIVLSQLPSCKNAEYAGSTPWLTGIK